MKKQTTRTEVAEKETYLTVERAGEILSLKGNTIRDYCKTGVLVGIKNSTSGQWRIAQSSVDAYLNGK